MLILYGKILLIVFCFMYAGETGAQIRTIGISSYFKPWYFDGSICWWGDPEYTLSGALDAASRIEVSVNKNAAKLRAKHLGHRLN